MRIILILPLIFLFSCFSADPVAKWHCNETSGSILYDNVNSLNGTLTGSRLAFITSGAGVEGNGFGNCLWTDNLNDYVDLGDADAIDFAKYDFTVTGWFKTGNAARHGYIIRTGAYNTGGYAVFIFKTTGKLSFLVYSSSSLPETDNKIVSSDAAIFDNTWHWFAAVVKDQVISLYVDGMLQSGSGAAYGANTTATAAAGTIAYINKDTAASVDEIIVYNNSLSAELSGNILTGGELYQDWQRAPAPQNCEQVFAAGFGLTGDINKDCSVNLEDIRVLGQNWLGVYNDQIPLFWRKPVSFDKNASGLGLRQLGGVTHTLLYAPLASSACLSEGGSGLYEGVLYGTYNHHQQIFVYDDKFVVYWTNHAKDENGPGQRLLARVGKFNSDRTDIDFGDASSIVQIAPPAALVNRRLYTHDPALISELFVSGGFSVINGSIYLVGNILAMAGWTDDPIYHGIPAAPVPVAHWRDNRETGFELDVWWKIGDFYQKWRFNGDILEPDGAMYKYSNFVTSIEITPGNFRAVSPVAQPYKDASLLANAPYQFRSDVLTGRAEPFSRTAYFDTSIAKRTAADGINGLAHIASYRTPNGRWVVIRDNLSNPGIYYAASIGSYYDNCPPAWPTNLYGFAQPDARELPDGRPYIICNSEGRKDMFITVSADGFCFDKTWLLLHSDRVKSDDGLFKSGGPQYFRSYVVGGNIWVVYSITKEQIGLTKIPVELLE